MLLFLVLERVMIKNSLFCLCVLLLPCISLVATAPDNITKVIIKKNKIEIRTQSLCDLASERGNKLDDRMFWYDDCLIFVDGEYAQWKAKWRFLVDDPEMISEASTWLPGETLFFQIQRSQKPWPQDRWVDFLSLISLSLQDGWIHNLDRQTAVKATLIQASVSALGCDGGGIWKLNQ
jgi:hypothetical protein